MDDLLQTILRICRQRFRRARGWMWFCVLPVVLAGGPVPPAHADTVTPRFELLHLWVTDEEAYALRALSDPMKARGVEWSETKVSTNFLGVRDLFAVRLALAKPPGGLFWLGGDRSSNLFELKMFRPIPNRVGNRSFSDELIPEVYDEVRSGDSIMLLPLGIHLQNRMLYNAEVIARLGLSMPQSWQELLNIAPVLKQNGVNAVALSDQRWQLRFFITSIMAEQFTFDEMREFLVGMGSARKFEPQLRRSTEMFLALRPYTIPASRDLNWTSVVEHIATGDAFAAFLGDFVAPMLAGNPAVQCAPALGNDYVIWSFDTIALVAVNDPAVIAGQDQLVETVMEPRNQQQYILRKGGVPAYRGLDSSQMDPCSRASEQSWETADSKILLTASQWTHTLDTIASILRPAWWDPDANSAGTTADLITAIDLMNERNRAPPPAAQ